MSTSSETVPKAGDNEWEHIQGITLHPATLSYISEKLKFTTMAPVQARVVPLLLSNYDVLVQAITGSGKTLAYLLPCVEMMLRPQNVEICRSTPNAVLGLVVLPSRELAQQVYSIAKAMLSHVSAHSSLKGNTKDGGSGAVFACQCYIGGRDIAKDVAEFEKKGGHLLVGTPGRLYELLVTSKYISLFSFAHFEMLVLDEADKLLEFGFKAKLDALIKRLPKQRRTGLFSATQTKELTDIARAGMRNPVVVTVRTVDTSNSGGGKKKSASGEENNAVTSKPQIPDRLTNYFAFTKASEKLERLVQFLLAHPEEKVLVYVMTCASVEWMVHALSVLLPEVKKAGALLALHGQMKLEKRQSIHRQVTRSEKCVLVCTDVAARGLDIPEVSVVVQFDPPVDPQTFIHRIGRTARMGRAGKSLVLLMPHEFEYVAFMQLQNVHMEPLDEEKDDADSAKEATGHLNARRTLYSAHQDHTNRKQAIHQAHKQKQLSRQERRELLQREHQSKKRSQTGEEPVRKEVVGDLCTSPPVIQLRREAMKDTTEKLLQLAARAFVSFIRAYKEHECRYIFQLQHIDLTDLTHGFGLFKIPNCGEIRHMQRLRIPLQEEFQAFVKVLNLKAREKREREEAIKVAADEEDDDDEEMGRKKQRIERNEKLEALKMSKMSQSERSKAWKQAEMDELIKDSYYVKKERQGKISARAMNERLGLERIENAFLSTRERQEKKRRSRNA